MTTYLLKYPVYTASKTLILPAGIELNENVMKEVMQMGIDKKFKYAALLDFGTIKKDILEFMTHPPYDIIFADPERTSAVIQTMSNINILEPILESLQYFYTTDFYTYRHMLLVFALSILISRELIRDNTTLTRGAMASPAHDFGKICIPIEILKKSNPLTLTERKEIEHHTLAGYVLLHYYSHHSNRPNELATRIARDHHERKNGTGYPIGIKLEDLMIEIIVVADIYDALISPRPYRPESFDNRTALEEISEKATRGEMSLNIVKALVSLNRKIKPHYSQCEISNKRRGEPPKGNTYGIIQDILNSK